MRSPFYLRRLILSLNCSHEYRGEGGHFHQVMKSLSLSFANKNNQMKTKPAVQKIATCIICDRYLPIFFGLHQSQLDWVKSKMKSGSKVYVGSEVREMASWL